MSEVLQVIMNLSVLVFVITSLLAMGLSLTVKQIIQPLRNARLVILALVANFVLVPILAYLIVLVIPLDEGLATGLLLRLCVSHQLGWAVESVHGSCDPLFQPTLDGSHRESHNLAKQGLLLWGKGLQDIVGRVHATQRAIYTYSQTGKCLSTKHLDDRPHSLVSASPSLRTQAQTPEWQVQIIIHD